ncbi:unnamed protein product [Rotaria socialis]|uniref:HTH CENPB-type domain-containing protein n=2 Tax=Rotaria socialis TaxID=392032 RepID=A0A818YTR1_9BILA|nr:unnamed protein product [Rotaria socialis]
MGCVGVIKKQTHTLTHPHPHPRPRRRSWKTVHNRYKSIPAQNYIARFRNYIAHQGTKRQKINNVDEYVYKKFLNAREKFLPVHDVDLCRWGLQAAKEYKIDNFRASSFWLLGFKTRHSICSRRITNIVTRHEVENAEVVQKSEIQFLKEYNSLKSKYLSHEILNTDQVGVEKELYSTRCLSFQAEKKTYMSIKSKHATTHCYTLQPTISLDGKVVGPILLCLQETQGKMDEQVKH